MKRGFNIPNVFISLLLLATGLWALIEGFLGIFSNLYLITTGGIGYWVLGGDLKSLIRPIKKRQILFIIRILLFSYVLSLTVFELSDHFLHMPSSDNPVIHQLSWITPFEKIPGLFGEEMLVIVLLVILEHYLPKNRTGLIIASILSSLLFGAAHLSTYDWNVWQSLVVIGLTRIPFTYAWYKSDRNLLVNGFAHWGYDMLIFILAIAYGNA
ncbi:type II CAAX prenyl endopeptidase Rce1 family protein [Paenibacillus sp. CGMCC 1.18879]|nr:CPBP family glutamic-type intramembrane protease [Paenibacillus sp. CGMCC 1.18879]MBY9080706.1 CPBP family intramembrane metalloprotease [Paenibacillus sp. CGMCC 1.18879]